MIELAVVAMWVFGLIIVTLMSYEKNKKHHIECSVSNLNSHNYNNYCCFFKS
ncbi:hypothetical protein LAPA6218_00835 [Lactobacillus paragasseri]|nr:hypothetical protein LJCM5344_01640 [Lactobacillus paragasseri]